MRRLAAAMMSFGICALTQTASASNPCGLYGSYTLDKQCDNGEYVGPNRPDLHGGVCLYWNTEVCTIDTYYTEDKNCNFGYDYVGPNRADYHGGYCISELTGRQTRVHYSMDKQCYSDEVYVEPNRPDLHGGTCLLIE